MYKIITASAAQWAYDNLSEVEAEYDDYEDCEYHRIELVEKYVTYANARDFAALCWREVEGDPNAWLTKLIGFEEGHWAFQFVTEELEGLVDSPSDDEIEAAAERSAKAVYALYN